MRPRNALAAQPGVRPIPGAYLVQLKPGTDARGLARALSVRPRHTYDSAVVGFAADLTSAQLAALRRHPHVTSIEQDAVVQNVQDIDFVTQYTPAWGLDRIDERYLPRSNSYRYPTGGAVVHAYVIDSGIDVSHPDFGGRASTTTPSTRTTPIASVTARMWPARSGRPPSEWPRVSGCTR